MSHWTGVTKEQNGWGKSSRIAGMRASSPQRQQSKWEFSKQPFSVSFPQRPQQTKFSELILAVCGWPVPNVPFQSLTHTEPWDTLCGLTDDIKTSNLQVKYQK